MKLIKHFLFVIAIKYLLNRCSETGDFFGKSIDNTARQWFAVIWRKIPSSSSVYLISKSFGRTSYKIHKKTWVENSSRICSYQEFKKEKTQTSRQSAQVKMCLNTVAAQLRDAFGKFLLHKNSSLCTVTFREKVL